MKENRMYKKHQKKHKKHYKDIKDKWEEFERKYWEKHPQEKYCHICGSTKKVELHHICPRHICPDKIFDESNLIPLCRKDHFTWGHLENYEWWNEHIREDAKLLYALFKKRKEEFKNKHEDIVNAKEKKHIKILGKKKNGDD